MSVYLVRLTLIVFADIFSAIVAEPVVSLGQIKVLNLNFSLAVHQQY